MIGSVVEGETRVVAVKAEIDNSGGVLKPGMFAELEVLTKQTSTATLAIPSSAVVEGNGKKQVYVQNGNAYQAVEVSLGQTSGDTVEVKTGLFEGDMIVTGRATQLYAQSLRGGSKPKEDEHTKTPSQATEAKTLNMPVPLWLVGVGGGSAIATIAFISGAFIAGRRPKHQPSAEFAFLSEESSAESPAWDDNHRVTPQESKSHQK